MEDMHSFWGLDRDPLGPCPICDEPGDCDCLRDDEEWWENAESEIAAAENLEEK